MKSSAIAIVGMAGRFPGARNIDEFWRNLRDGVETIHSLSSAELLAAGVAPDVAERPDYVKAAALLEGVDMFDASFFGLSPRDAAIMDPQHRHFLECAWEAIEHAGHTPESFSGSIGVFAGSGTNGYLLHNLLNNRQLTESAGLFLIRQTGNDKDVLATRVSYQLDLHGPSLNVQTACSTSLVAVHLACQSLLGGECDMALAGGVTIEIPHAQGYVYREGEILSRDGHCRAFDAASSGTVFSSGVGIVVLRRLEDAIADHDTVHAVILGSAVNNDGQRKAGFLAPSVAGQAAVIEEALGVAGLSAETISYVEAHGTGTALGDPLEIKGLTEAFRKDTGRKGYCAIGSLKTNVGHLDAAAGVGGLIKTVLALRHRQLPASLHYRDPNPHIDFQNSPFFVNGTLTSWKSDGTPRRAGVTSLGIGGTNAHVILEEAPEPERPGTTLSPQLVPLSANTEPALAEAAARLSAYLRLNPDLRLADIAFTCQVGRKAFRHRRIVAAATIEDAALQLASPETQRGFTGIAAPRDSSSTLFLFSGQGSQYPKMGSDLYANQPVFREWLDRCSDQLVPHLGLDLRTVLYPAEDDALADATLLNRTSITQPALFALEYSLAQWWMAVGVRPQAMLGHSIGEYVAACLANVLSLEDALAITAYRGQLMEQCQPGSMLAVALPLDEVPHRTDLSIAAVNSHRQCVVSGPGDAVTQLERALVAKGVTCHRLRTSHAFHSSMMDPILESFLARMREVSLSPPLIPYLSNLTGTWMTDSDATDPEYWAKHLRSTVRFSDCVAQLLRVPDSVMIEVGPGRTLASLARENIGNNKSTTSARIYSSLRRSGESIADTSFLLGTLGQLWIGGQTVDWSALHAGQVPSRIGLPTYPFERKRFWIDPDKPTAAHHPEPLSAPLAPSAHAKATDEEIAARTSHEIAVPDRLYRWFFKRRWVRTKHRTAGKLEHARWLVFLDPNGLGKQVSTQLRDAGHQVVEVNPGRKYKRNGNLEYTIRCGVRQDYDALLGDLHERGISPQRLVHLWSMRALGTRPSLDEKLDLSFFSLVLLAQAIGDADYSDIDIAVISDRLHSISGEPVFDPVCATLLGPAKIIPKEFPGITCRIIDVDLRSQDAAILARQIIAEHCAAFSDSVVAIRQGERWVETLEHCDPLGSSGPSRFRQKGVYLITGGLGDLGLVIAEELARHLKARLVLFGRTPLPPADLWESALAEIGTPDRIKQRIARLIQIQSLGAEVLAIPGDVGNPSDVKRAIELACATFGSINGVIHAAGVIDDGPLQIKSRDIAASVLGPKVKGTLVLDDALKDAQSAATLEAPLDFFALFSSVSSIAAPAGQVDYAAANAFLDSFAVSQQSARVFTINWGPWSDVGMAARTSSPHPLVDRRLFDTAAEIAYSTTLSHDNHWVLSEHRMRTGEAVLPGTCYLELASASLAHGSFEHGVEFDDVFFLSPLVLDRGESRLAHVNLERDQDGFFRFSVRARAAGWIEHASGRIARCRMSPPADRAIEPIAARCRLRELTFDDMRRTEQERFFEFGPRWRCLASIKIGKNEALAELELSEEFSDDAAHFHLHPALLDLATGSALYLIEDYGPSSPFYYPISYKRAVIYRRIPPRFFSHIRSRQKNEAGRDVATFDMSLIDPDGRVLAEIEGFSMRLVRDPHDVLGNVAPHVSAPVKANGVLHQRPSRGITSGDGARAFMTIVSSDHAPGVFVLPDGPPAMTFLPEKSKRPLVRKVVSGEDIETLLMDWWRESLGHEQVGLDDDFFELGGQSLHVVRHFAKIKKLYGIDFNLSVFFEARTIRSLAQLVRDARSKSSGEHLQEHAVVPIQAKGQRRPLYVVSGLDGHVLAFHRLAHYLGEDQPVFGLAHRGSDGRELDRTSVEEIAQSYVSAIRKVQPEGPYRVVGHSFGGIVAFEVAQQLLAHGGTVSMLGLFDTIEPRYSRQVWESLGFGKRIAVHLSEFRFALRDRDLFGPLRRRFQKTRAIISSIFKAERSPVPQPDTNVKDRNLIAAANYEPKVYPSSLTLFRSTVRGIKDGEDEVLGWGQVVAGDIEIRHIPATHGNIVNEPAVRILAKELAECLDRDAARAHSNALSATVCGRHRP
jgi:acyl transferase domain-containing protein/thioesterase domain-containing protein/acyl carrier protein